MHCCPLHSSVLWEDTLRDSLLSYCGTPKGLLLLQQTGALKDCVTYMFSRHVRKLQVRSVISHNSCRANATLLRQIFSK